MKKNRPSGLKYKIKKINPSWFKKGEDPWINGGRNLKPNGGSFKPGHLKGLKTRFNSLDYIGNKNYKWKDKEVGYSALHSWVVRNLGKAYKCSNIACKHLSDRYEWSNKSNQYKRELNDWEQLCKKCHAKKDKQVVGHIERRFGVNHNVY